MESFFGTLKTELVHAARRDLFAYIEAYYNRQRIHSAIGYITPDRQRQCPRNPVSTLPGEARTTHAGLSAENSGTFSRRSRLRKKTLPDASAPCA